MSLLFDDFERTDATLKKHGEDSFHFLNRAASAFWAAVRNELERWFQAYPAADRADLHSRFRSRKPDQHWAAWWELYLYRVLTALGFDIEVHPEVQEGPGRPDFRVAAEQNFYLEAATVFSGIVEEARHAEREAWILDALNEGKSANFFVSITFVNVGMERPSTREVLARVEEWLESLDPDAVESSMKAGQRGPAHEFAFRDWRIRLGALPKRAEARKESRHHLVGIGPMSVGFVNDREMLWRTFDRKKTRHSKVDAPLVLAVLATSPVLDDEDVAQALFGSETVVIDSGEVLRKPNGLWQTTRGRSARGVSAVLIGSGISPWSITGGLPRLWLNPWAIRPLRQKLPFPRATIESDQIVFEEESQPAHEIFGLPADWPSDPDLAFEPGDG